LAALGVLLGGCDWKQGEPEPVVLEGAWVFERLEADEGSVAAGDLDDPFTVRFASEGRLRGHSVCNGYQGRYEVEGKRLTVRSVSSTDAYCGVGNGAVEEVIFAGVRDMLHEVEGNTLRIQVGGGEIVWTRRE
jgi:hypothetical protein